MEPPQKKMCTRSVLEEFFPREISSRCMNLAGTEAFEAMEYWKEISKQNKTKRFPLSKKTDSVSWESWVGENRWEPEYKVEPCHNCKSPCSIYNDKIYIDVGYKVTDFCSYKCMMEGESFAYAKYEKMKYKYAYD